MFEYEVHEALSIVKLDAMTMAILWVMFKRVTNALAFSYASEAILRSTVWLC